MHASIKKLGLIAASAIPAAALFAGTASAAVSQYSKLKNGDFETSAAHWSTSAYPSAQISETFGLGKLANTTNTAVATNAYAAQCVKLDGGIKYELSGKVYLGKNQKRTGHANMALQFFANESCSGTPVSQAYTPWVTEYGAWKKQTLTMNAPKSTESARVLLLVSKDGTNVKADAKLHFVTYFDDVQLLQKSIKIPDGPIIVNPTPDPDPHPDPNPQPNPNPNPNPNPQPQPDPNPQPDPSPQPNPNPNPQPQPNPNPQPNPDPAPQDEPVEEPAPQTGEEDVPGPDVPQAPEDEPADPAPQGGGSNSGGNGGNTPADNSGANGGPGDDGQVNGQDVQTLGDTEQEQPKDQGQPKQPASTDPTPAAPETGNASGNEGGLLGATELGVIGGAALAGIGLAVVLAARARRKQEEGPRIG